MRDAQEDHGAVWYAYLMCNRYTAGIVVIALFVIQSNMVPVIVSSTFQLSKQTDEQICIDDIINYSAELSPWQPHVTRDMEEDLKEYIGTVDDAYLVLVGPRGCGKSVGIVAAAEGMEGVIVVTLTESSVAVSALVMAQVCPDYPVDHAMSARKLGDLFRAAILEVKRRSNGVKVWAPTVVVEVEQGVMDSVVLGVAKSMKHLGSDTQTCRAVMVLSDAHGAFALPTDDTRVKIIWVEDFSPQEAHKLLDELNFLPVGSTSWDDGIDANILYCARTRSRKRSP
jgi:hypothetical protein